MHLFKKNNTLARTLTQKKKYTLLKYKEDTKQNYRIISLEIQQFWKQKKSGFCVCF